MIDAKYGFSDYTQWVSCSDLVHAFDPCRRPIRTELSLGKHELERNTMGPTIVPGLGKTHSFSSCAGGKASPYRN
jgi:hypothetical protein